MKENRGVWIAFVIVATSSVFIFTSLAFTGFFAYQAGTEANLTIWDSTEPKGGSVKVYADGSWKGTTLAKFFANYTNITSGESVNGSGVGCNISFNISTGWTSPAAMWFNGSSLLYESNYTFDSRGFYKWNVTCDGSSQGYDILSVTDDNVTIRNTPPYIDDLDPKTCYEDSMCIYDFSADCHDIDDIDENNLTYGYVAGTEFTGFNIDPDTGNTTVYVTTDNDCGEFTVSLAVLDGTGSGAVGNKSFTVNAVNDKPVLGSVPASSDQNSSLYYDIDATDEESSEFYFNITFLSCYRPFNGQHTNLTECSALFVINNTSGEINRTGNFSNSEVGNYTINFTVTDPGDNATSVPPYMWLENKTDWQVVDFSVIDLNDRPSIDTVPDQFWAQNENRKLVINASDIDNGTLVFNATTLYRNLSVYYDPGLFPITLNETAYLDNGTSLGNGTMDFSPVQNSQVGNYTVNISVYDGRAGGTHSILVDFTVLNVNDPPNLSFVCKNYSVQGLGYACDVGENTTDPDDFPSYVPYSDPVNGTLTFKINFTYCNKTFNSSDTNCSIFGIDQATGVINYTDPLRKDSGNYTLNISVEDGGNLVDWEEFNLTVIPDYQPNITTSVPSQSATQNQSFFLSLNATDLDNVNDNLTFRTETYYQGSLLNDTLFPIQTDKTFWVSDNITMGIMNYTVVNNSQVGNYSVRIIVNDTWGREDLVLVNFTVYNINDLPVMDFSCANSTYEDNEYACDVGENTTDADSETPYGETLIYNLSFISGPPLFDINTTTGMINFTADNDSWANGTYNFTYVLNITVTDSNGSVDWEELNLTIHAVNDPPQFNFTNRTAWENSKFFMDLGLNTTDEENDTPFFYNLTFIDCSRVSGTNCSVISMNNATGVVNRTQVFEGGEVGNYTINVTVTDSGNTTEPQNATGWQLIEFRVLPINYPPSADIVGAIPSNVIDENETVILAINVTDPDGDDVTCMWFMNATQIGSVSQCQDYNSWSHKASFEDSGNWTFRVEATDSLLTDSDQWDVIIRNVNRPPELVFIIPPQEWAANNNKHLYPNLSYYVRDPDNRNNVSNDDNNLTITYAKPPHMTSVMIDGQASPVNVNPNWTGDVMFIPQTDWYGADYIVFTVNDSEYNISTNNITLNVSYSEIGTETILRQTEGGGYAISETKIAVLSITVSPLKGMGSNDQTYVTVTLKNAGEVTLNNINLIPFVKESNEISLSFSRVNVNQLGVGDEVDSNLTIETLDLTKDEYEIKITGSVTNPRFNQSTSIYLRPLYNRTKLEERIQMTKDLFQDNPECLDLTELIFEAEKELDQDNLGKAKELTETALENCRDIIRYTNETKRRVTPGLESIPLNEITIGLLSIALLSILVYLWLGSRAEAKRAVSGRG